MKIRRTLFFTSAGAILYTYIGFPILLLIRGLVWHRTTKKDDALYPISLLIVAYNEVATIGAKLDNIADLEYPRELLEVIVASDGSDDGTNEIVASYAERGVRLLPFGRRGKIPALNDAVTRATGTILVFSDANSMYAPDALRALMRSFADPTVGAVAGNQCYLAGDDGHVASSGERLYWSFDRTLKIMQNRAGNVTSATGAIHAIRKELFRPVPLGVGDDFVISTRAIAQGYRLVFEPDAIAYEGVAPSDEAEFNRKTRVIVRGLRGLWAVKELFNPLGYGFYAVQIFSHKLLRWSVGWLLIVLFGASCSLWRAGFGYRLSCQLQLAFYVMALLARQFRGSWAAGRREFKLLSLPYYFCLANLAALQAWVQLVRGKRIDAWNSKRRFESPGITTEPVPLVLAMAVTQT